MAPINYCYTDKHEHLFAVCLSGDIQSGSIMMKTLTLLLKITSARVARQNLHKPDIHDIFVPSSRL